MQYFYYSTHLLSGFPAVVVALTMSAIYLLPAIIAVSRGHPNRISIAILNVFLGWTLFGWIVTLFWSLSRFWHA